MANDSLGKAKAAKNDEFYTQYGDIEAEMNAYVEYNPDVFRGKTILLPCDDPEWSNFTKYFAANFERFGLKKLISTSYAKGAANHQITLFEMMSPLFDADKHETRGKLFTLTHDKNASGNVDTDDIEFSGYLEGDGDFRSEEVCRLRDEADIIITNPPFSLFREFLAWILKEKKLFIILGNKNALTYKEVFPYIKENRVWLGATHHSGGMDFYVPDEYNESSNIKVGIDGRRYVNIPGPRWFTNIDNGWRHQPLILDTMAHNLKYNKKLRKDLEKEHGAIEYPKYANFNAIDVPITECIPSDYDGIMGVPVTFMDKYDPEQFEIIGCPDYTGLYGSDDIGIQRIGEEWISNYRSHGGKGHYTANMTSLVYFNARGEACNTFKRILIRSRKGGIA